MKRVRLSLDVSVEMNPTLEAIADAMCSTKSEVLRRAVALMEVALAARLKGKKIGLAAMNSTVMTTEITGLFSSLPETVGVTEAERDAESESREAMKITNELFKGIYARAAEYFDGFHLRTQMLSTGDIEIEWIGSRDGREYRCRVHRPHRSDATESVSERYGRDIEMCMAHVDSYLDQEGAPP